MDRIYRLILRLGLILVSPYLLLGSRRYWPTLSDRLGHLKLPQLHSSIWVHAVSVGEVRAVEALLLRIRREFPHHPLVVSTTTPTGQGLAREKTGIIDHTFYFPIDLPSPVARALDRIRPRLVIIAETEIWPTFLRACRQRKVPVMMINGRISDRSFPRYRRVSRWLRPVLNDYALLGMQSEIDRRRIEAMGADPSRVKVLGNLKYDVQGLHRSLDESFAAILGRLDPLWIAASTMPGEDELVLDAFAAVRKTIPQLKLMIAPRHPKRADDVAALARSRTLKTGMRSAPRSDDDVLVLNTIGELAATFEYASIVFVGGSLVNRGGHNILEPAQSSKPIVFGPHMENFRDIARLFVKSNAAIQIASASLLAETVNRVLADRDLALTLGRNANRLVLENAGATERAMELIKEQVTSRSPSVTNVRSR